MQYLVLDTNILLKDINVINRWSPQFRILIPKFVLNELDQVSSRLRYNKEIFEILNNSNKKGFVQITQPDLAIDDYKQFHDMPTSQRLSETDYLLFKYVQQLIKQGKDAILVSNDRALARYAGTYGVSWLSLEGLYVLYTQSDTTTIDFLKKEDTILKYQRRKLIIGFILGVLVSVVSYFVINNFSYIYSSASTWGTLIILVLGGFSFFIFRNNYRLQYGLVEYLFGFYITLRVFTSKTFNYELLEMIDFIQIVGGIYVMVRGLSNFSEGIKGTLLQPVWNKIFRIK
jgi:rRNA-processing protein FCF1